MIDHTSLCIAGDWIDVDASLSEQLVPADEEFEELDEEELSVTGSISSGSVSGSVTGSVAASLSSGNGYMYVSV